MGSFEACQLVIEKLKSVGLSPTPDGYITIRDDRACSDNGSDSGSPIDVSYKELGVIT